MDLLQRTLREALEKNEAETSKWQKHKDEMVEAEASLREYQKKLQVELMVPIGSKALMPGFLYHTGEVTVGHGNKTFSKCTTLQAIRICKHRQRYADTRLEELQTEHDLHSNRLELPFASDAFASGGQEIIEEYDEETEQQWRVEHRKRVAESKMKEAEERKRLQAEEGKTHDDVMNLLDEMELMEELDQDLEEMNIETDEQLQKIMSGDLKLPPEKKRTTRVNKNDDVLGALENVKEDQQDPVEVKQAPTLPKQPQFTHLKRMNVETDELLMSILNSEKNIRKADKAPPKRETQELDSDDEEEPPPPALSSLAPAPPKPPRTFASSPGSSDNIKVNVAVNGPQAAGSSYERYEATLVSKPETSKPAATDSESETSTDDGVLSEQVQAQWKKIQQETKAMNIKQKKKYLTKKFKDTGVSLRGLEIHDERTLALKIDLEELQDLLRDELYRLEQTEEGGDAAEFVEPSSSFESAATGQVAQVLGESIAVNNAVEKQGSGPALEAAAEVKTQPGSSKKGAKKKKRSKITFANEDDIKIIDKFEAPSQVSEPTAAAAAAAALVATAASPRPKTLEIEVSFTDDDKQSPPQPTQSEDVDVILSPADIYRKFGHCMNRTPASEEKEQPTPSEPEQVPVATTKSILKNKEKVLEEVHVNDNLITHKSGGKKAKKTVMQVQDIMGDVVERPVDYQASTSKENKGKAGGTGAKVSKFKSSRSNKK